MNGFRPGFRMGKERSPRAFVLAIHYISHALAAALRTSTGVCENLGYG